MVRNEMSILLPYIQVQHDWDIVFQEIADAARSKTEATLTASIWVSGYSQDIEDGVQASFDVTLEGDGGFQLVGHDDEKNQEITARAASAKRLEMSCTKIGKHSQQIFAPSTRFRNLHPHGDDAHIYSVDVCAKEGKGISGSSDGTVRLWDHTTGDLWRDLVGHQGEVNTVKWFPSGKVALSAGADTRIKIWATEPGKCAKTLTGHTRGITDSIIVDQGRNIITSSKDGTVKLWDCGQGLVSSTKEPKSPQEVNSCILHDAISHDETSSSTRTESLLVLMCCEDGYLRGHDFRQDSQSRMNFYAGAPVNCVTQIGEYQLAIGQHDGTIQVIDLRRWSNEDNSRAVVAKTRVSDGAIMDIGHLHQLATGTRKESSFSVWVANQEGGCLLVSLDSIQSASDSLHSGSVLACCTGVDCEPIYSITASSTTMYTSSRGCVFQYQLTE